MKRVLIVLLVIGIVAGTWYLYDQQQDKKATLPEGYKTTRVTRQSLVALVSATGNIESEREQQLSFSVGGTVSRVLVHEGERVTRNQELAQLDNTDLVLAVDQAKAALAVAQAQLAKTKAGPKEEDLAAYEAAVEIAKAGVVSAQAAVDSARANLEKVKAGPTAEDIEIAQRRVEEAKNALWGAQAQRDAICGRVKYGVAQADCDNAEANVYRSEESVRIAELQLRQLQQGARNEDIAAAKAQLDQALGQLQSAQAQVTKAEADLARARKGPSAEDIAIAEAQVEQARVGVQIAEAKLDDAILTAPFDGYLAQWDLHEGDTVTPGAPVGTLIDDSQYHITLSIDETEVARIKPGLEAVITLDAFPDQQLKGSVTSVNAAGKTAQGLITYDVRIDMEPSTLPIKSLMTASVDIVVERKQDVLVVPNRALRRDQQGRYVEILKDGIPQKAYVEIGVSDSTWTEILEGVSEGQEIVVSRPRESIFSGPFGGG